MAEEKRPSAPIHSPVAQSLKNTLNVSHSDAIGLGGSSVRGKHLIISYQNSTDFNFLWNFWEDESKESSHHGKGESPPNGEFIKWLHSDNGLKHLFIVWDGIPQPSEIGNVYLGTYVTPYDWLIALAISLSEHRAALGNVKLKVYIIDLVSERRGPWESAQLFHQFQYGPNQILPWVKAYQPINDAQSKVNISTLLQDFLTSVDTEEPRIEQSLQAIRRVWMGRLLAPSNPRDRHAIANLIGPQILILGMESSSASSMSPVNLCLTALLTLMRVFGLLPAKREKIKAPWVDVKQWKPDWLPKEALRFILLDDMADLGWKEFLFLALGIDKTTLFVSEAPDVNCFGPARNKRLIDLLADESGQLRVNQGFKPLGEGKEVIMFLDLRLFNRRSKEDEIQFFKKLLTLASQAEDNDSSRAKLPWKGFTSQELSAVKSCVTNQKVEDEDYLVALTLLPRLISLVDPMLPIVLFSSTGQRRIAESLKGYGTIITHFDKPRFFGNVGASLIQETSERLKNAVDCALMILKGKSVCQTFKTGNAYKINSSGKYHVEIFIDEADTVGQNTFRIGGIALIYNNEEKAEEFNKKMLDKGLRWGSTDIEPEPSWSIDLIDKDPRPESLYESKIYTPLNKLIGDLGLRPPIGFVLQAPEVKWNNSTDLTSPACLDNLYRDLVAQALEVLFYEVLPTTLKQKEPHFTCDVHLASRPRYQARVDNPQVWDKSYELNITACYGVRIRKDKYGKLNFLSINSDSVHPIVTRVRSLMPEAKISIRKARGCQLRYERDDSYPDDLPRPAHLLADVVARRAIRETNQKLKNWLNNGFNSTANARFTGLLEACRHARAGRHVEALVSAYKATRATSGRNKLEGEKWAEQRIIHSAEFLSQSGEDFVRLCEQLDKS